MVLPVLFSPTELITFVFVPLADDVRILTLFMLFLRLDPEFFIFGFFLHFNIFSHFCYRSYNGIIVRVCNSKLRYEVYVWTYFCFAVHIREFYFSYHHFVLLFDLWCKYTMNIV